MSTADKPIDGPVYVTKWALTRGILVYRNGGRVVDDKYFHCSDPAYCFVDSAYWTTSEEVAKSAVRRMAERRRKSLTQQALKMADLADGVTKPKLIEVGQ